MAKKLAPKCKQCRREGKKLFLKGDRCNTSKCSMVKRNYPPGAHGPKGYGRLTTYGLQLREKQKAKKIYGLLETQFKNYFIKASKKRGDTAKLLVEALESRLDNVIFRAGFAKSRSQARQIVSYHHLLVNSKPVNIPSFHVKTGNIISLSKKEKYPIKNLKETLEGSKYSWLAINPDLLEIKITDQPNTEEITGEFNPTLITEFYSR